MMKKGGATSLSSFKSRQSSMTPFKENNKRNESAHPFNNNSLTELEKGNAILEEVCKAAIFQKEAPRQFPMFKRDEIEFGQVLGLGAFGVVREVTNMRGESDEEQAVVSQEKPCLGKDANHHYDIATARKRMINQCMRNGDARYAVKYLRTQDVSGETRMRGRVDLAIEIQYLHALNHPNICKMRGYFDTENDPFHTNNFFLMDRLYGTLEDRIAEWKLFLKENLPKGFILSKSKRIVHDGLVQELLQERLLIAYDIASAFRYMHFHKLVYRDVKLENVGFDIRGDVKIFDFGLVKALNPEQRIKGSNNLYNLTAYTGSLPYMAPEIATRKPYNEKVDVFSFAILFWEILALKSGLDAFPTHIKTRRDYLDMVVKDGCRPTIKSKLWPLFSKQVLKTAWDKEATNRPSMSQICTMLQADLQKMTTDNTVLNRTSHMMNRSSRSWRAAPQEILGDGTVPTSHSNH